MLIKQSSLPWRGSPHLTGRGRPVLPGPCFHEEAGTRLFLHVADCGNKGCKKVCIRIVDTDVVVLSIAMSLAMTRIKRDKLWVAFGTGANFKYIPVHQLVEAIGPEIRSTMPVFHALTENDTVSPFGGRGKKTAWNTWQSH